MRKTAGFRPVGSDGRPGRRWTGPAPGKPASTQPQYVSGIGEPATDNAVRLRPENAEVVAQDEGGAAAKHHVAGHPADVATCRCGCVAFGPRLDYAGPGGALVRARGLTQGTR
jgi:hypothetical protein